MNLYKVPDYFCEKAFNDRSLSLIANNFASILALTTEIMIVSHHMMHRIASELSDTAIITAARNVFAEVWLVETLRKWFLNQ